MLSMNVWGNADQEPSEEPNTAAQLRLPAAEYNAKMMNINVLFGILQIIFKRMMCWLRGLNVKICGIILFDKTWVGLVFLFSAWLEMNFE